MKKNLLLTGAFFFATFFLSAQTAQQGNSYSNAPVIKADGTINPTNAPASDGKLAVSAEQNKTVGLQRANLLQPQKLGQNIKDKPNPQPVKTAGSVPAPAK